MSTRPTELKIRTYQVGFGDCFLLSFTYPRFERHVLVDFGSTGLPDGFGSAKAHMLKVAKDIAARCDGTLHAVVATHRHADHISGFTTSAHGESGDIIRSLKPKVVVQPWTENPQAPRKGTGAAKGTNAGRKAHLATLSAMQGVAEAAADAARRMQASIDFKVASELAFIGDDNKLANRSAVRNLMTMAARGGQKYVAYGSKSGLESVLPGVKIRVLGPPTLTQTNSIKQQRAKDPVEFWQFWKHQLAASSAVADGGKALFPKAVVKSSPQSTRWLRRRLNQVHADSLLQLVRILDSAMNNTSVILLFETGGKRLLFPGDAQFENWQYALSQDGVTELLTGIDLYKVGHHGSLNATPKAALWPRISKGSTKKRKHLQTLVSTMPGKHGHVESGTEVPRSKLIRELKAKTKYFTTESLVTKNALYDETTIRFR